MYCSTDGAGVMRCKDGYLFGARFKYVLDVLDVSNRNINETRSAAKSEGIVRKFKSA